VLENLADVCVFAVALCVSFWFCYTYIIESVKSYVFIRSPW